MFAAKFVGTTVEGSNFEAAITKGFTVSGWVFYIQARLPLSLHMYVACTNAQVSSERVADLAETVQIHFRKQCRQCQNQHDHACGYLCEANSRL